jgi:hypothetical protein
VHADNVSTIGTSVFFGLACQKLVHAIGFEFFEVLYHAHAIECSVASVYAIEVLAGNLVALITVLRFVLCKFLAFSFNKTVFPPGKTAYTVKHFASLSWHAVSVG